MVPSGEVPDAQGVPGAPRVPAVPEVREVREVLAVLHRVVDAVRDSLEGHRDWGPSGLVEGQYHHDLVADRAALEVLDEAGFGVVSEESGERDGRGSVVVVIDPIDGSTNAGRGLPWWATSVCALDADGPLAAVVANQATGTRFVATRGGGATCDGKAITPAAPVGLDRAIVAFSGWPDVHLGWAQYRSLGAAALDLCAVASGALDGFVDCAPTSLAPWDYLGGLLVCREAGAAVGEAWGRELVVRRWGPRRTVVAASGPALLDELVAGRRRLAGGPPPADLPPSPSGPPEVGVANIG